ncbi:MAG: hypothetical protein HYV08_11820 [Deltaproteobacteria bacterium]|nr:hypothetical protein [Deltaproteobacteria bacterium]
MIDLSNYREKLSEGAHRAILLAIKESQKRQHYYLGIEHIFMSLIEVERPLFDEVARDVQDGLGRGSGGWPQHDRDH